MIRYFCDLCDKEIPEEEIEEYEGSRGICISTWENGEPEYIDYDHICKHCRLEFRKKVMRLFQRLKK